MIRYDGEDRFRDKQKRDKITWLFNNFSNLLGDDPKVEDYHLDNRYWILFYVLHNKKDVYGYSFLSSLNNIERLMPCYAKGVDYRDLDKSKLSIMLCIDLDVPFVSNKLFFTEDSMEFWYLSAIVEIKQPCSFEIEEDGEDEE